MKNIVILISGGGSNMAAMVRTAQQQQWDKRLGARVAAVVSNKADAAGLAFAQAQGIATEVLDHKPFATREAFDAALAERIDRHDPALVVLAGFMRILGAAFVNRFAGRMINIHPSLLPAFWAVSSPIQIMSALLALTPRRIAQAVSRAWTEFAAVNPETWPCLWTLGEIWLRI